MANRDRPQAPEIGFLQPLSIRDGVRLVLGEQPGSVKLLAGDTPIEGIYKLRLDLEIGEIAKLTLWAYPSSVLADTRFGPNSIEAHVLGLPRRAGRSFCPSWLRRTGDWIRSCFRC